MLEPEIRQEISKKYYQGVYPWKNNAVLFIRRDTMYEKGDWIMYGNTGVCRVEDIGMPGEFPAMDKNRPYYKLDPAYEAGEIYIPVDTGMFMRPILTKEQAEQLLAGLPEFCQKNGLSVDFQQLEGQYQECQKTHMPKEWMKLLVVLRFKEWEQAQAGKRIGKIYQKYEKRAKELLYGELSIALGSTLETVEAEMEKKFMQLFSKTV